MSDISYATENDLLAQRASAQQFVDAGAATDPGTVAALVHMAAAWPDLEPGAVLGYAQSGYTAQSPEVAAGAQAAASIRSSQPAPHKVNTWGDFNNLSPAEKKQAFADDPALVDDYKRWIAAGGGRLPTAQDVTGRGFVGGGLHALGEAGSAVETGLGEAIHQVGHMATHGGQLDTGYQSEPLITALPGGSTLNTGGEAAVRTTALAANYPLQLAQGAVREVAGGHNPLNALQPGPENTRLTEQTQLGQATKSLAVGNQVDIGAGLLPDPNSATARAAASAARAAAPTIGTHAFTLGRYIGSQVFEPNSTPYKLFSGLIDAGIALKADPTYFAAKTISEARAANALFPVEGVTEEQQAARAEAGLSTATTHPIIDDQRLSDYLGSSKWLRNVDKFLTNTQDNPSALLRASGYQIPDVAVADRLASARTPDEFNAVIADYRNTQVTPNAVTYHPTQAAGTRLTTMVPPRSVDPSDRLGTVKAMEQTMVAGHVPTAARDTVINAFIRDSSRDSVGAAKQAWENTLVEQGMVAKFGGLAQADLSTLPADVRAQLGEYRSMLRDRLGIHTSTIDGLQSYDYDTLTNGERWRVGMPVVGGDVIPGPSLDSEMLQNLLELPIGRDISRLTSRLAPLYDSTPYQKLIAGPEGGALAERAVGVFKGAVLAKGGLLTKFVAEAQILGAAYGINTWNHPLNWIGAVIADREGRFADLLKRLGVEPRYLNDPEGQSFIESGIGKQLQKSWSQSEDPARTSLAGFVPIARSDKNAATAYAEELGRMANDRVTRQLARSGSTAATVDWLMHDPAGQSVLADLTDRWDNINEFNAARVARGEADGIANGPVDLTTETGIARYVDQHHAARLADWTSGNPEALDAVARRRLGGGDIFPSATGGASKPATARAQELLDAGIGPTRIKARLSLLAPATAEAKKGIYDRVVRSIYHSLIEVPDSTLNKSPAWRQLVWQKSADLAPYLDPAEKDLFLAGARDANLPDAEYAALADKAASYTGDGERLSTARLTELAKGRAASALPQMTHDLMNTSQLGDMLRLIVPFGDAFRKIITRWGTAVAENPQLLRRAQQGIEAARQPGSAVVSQVLGDPVPAGQGFFHKDANSGQEVWTMPGSTFIDKALLGIPVPLTANVSGLNMVTQGYPSISGPALTIPASYLRQAIPGLQSLDGILFPTGVPQDTSIPGVLSATFQPGWAKQIETGLHLLNGPADERAFAQTFNATLKNLASTGDYQLIGPNAASETQRLVSDARDDAKWLYVIRGVSSAVAPSSITPEQVVKDPSGHLAVLKVIQDQYQAQVNKVGSDRAMDWLVRTYGANNIFIPQAASTPNGYTSPALNTTAGQRWADAHPEVRATYPTTFSLFAPTSKTFDPNAFTDQFTKGERTTLTPAQQIAAAENRVGQWLYYKQRDKLLAVHPSTPTLTKNDQAALSNYKTSLEDNLPGFNTFEASPYDQVKKRDSAIRELIAASRDPRVSDTQAAQGLSLYLQARQIAITESHALGLKTPFQSKKTTAQRDYLRSVANAVVKQYPDFGPMWDLVFSHELAAN